MALHFRSQFFRPDPNKSAKIKGDEWIDALSGFEGTDHALYSMGKVLAAIMGASLGAATPVLAAAAAGPYLFFAFNQASIRTRSEIRAAEITGETPPDREKRTAKNFLLYSIPGATFFS